MPRKPRVEYAGAVYHVMSRGNHRQAIFRTDQDREVFLATLGEVCQRTGWRVHAYILMGNHYHLALETPEGNLVAGMQWLQSTYTKRFNAFHREWGHLFQGRYKAIPVESGAGYFSTLATYIHLNPARMKGYDFERERLADFRWSSYPAMIGKAPRPDWLCRKRVLDGLGLADTPSGRRKYAEYMKARVSEVRHSAAPWKANADWDKLRRGWHLGGEAFRNEMLERVGGALKKGQRASFGGEERTEHDFANAEQWISSGMERLGITDADLDRQKMNSPEKYALAWLVRRNTCVRPAWIKARLRMGTATCFAGLLRKLEKADKGGWGYAERKRVENIKL